MTISLNNELKIQQKDKKHIIMDIKLKLNEVYDFLDRATAIQDKVKEAMRSVESHSLLARVQLEEEYLM